MGVISDRFDFEDEDNGFSLDHVFEEEPVSLDVFVTDAKFLANPPLSQVQYNAVRQIERIYLDGWDLGEGGEMTYTPENDLYQAMAREFDPYWGEIKGMKNLTVLQWGKGSGKDHICRVASMRVAYLLLCLRSPQHYFGMPAQDTIQMLNIASSSNQALNAFFTPMTKAVKRGWFESRCEPKQSSIVFAKNIEAISGHSDAEGQEGGNLILGIADEIDAFRTKAEVEQYRGKAVRESSRSAESITKMLRTSSSTRFPRTWKNVYISYPRYLGSTIQQWTERGKMDIENRGEERSRYYVSGPMATWEVNPRVKGKEVFQDDYDEDPVMARAMYECKPSHSSDTYFKNMDVVRAAMLPEENPVSHEYVLREVFSELTQRYVIRWDADYTLSPSFRPIQGALYALHADLAIKGDKAGVAMSHVVGYEKVTDTVLNDDGAEISRTFEKPVVKTDFHLYLSADSREEPAREIQIRWVRELVKLLVVKGFAVGSVTYDQFQSTDSIQQLMDLGIEAEKLSVDRSDEPWKTWKDLLNEGRHAMPFGQRLLDEIEGLARIKGKVDHMAGKSKDIADAVCGSITAAIMLGGEEDPDGEIAQPGTGDEVLMGPELNAFDFGPNAYGLPEGMDYGMLRSPQMPEMPDGPFSVLSEQRDYTF